MSGDSRAKDLIDLGDKLFSKKDPLNSLMQEIAELYYPQRATFITEHQEGRDYASHILDAYPVMARRELGNSISSMLRPRGQPWFMCASVVDEMNNEPEVAQYLEYLTSSIRTNMYHAKTQFVRATKEADHDFITFGQCVISCMENPMRDAMHYRNHHLRDCAWLENAIGSINHLHRKDKMSARQMVEKFGEKNCHKAVKTASEKEPGKEFNIRAIAMPSAEYDKTTTEGKKRKLPYVVVYVDADNCHMIREDADYIFPYAVPRWATVSGSQYAYSPATWDSLPDGRMTQQMARILLEAGEKSVDPPIVANSEVIRESNLQAGAITWADVEPGGRLVDSMMPIDIKADMRTGFAMRADLRQMVDSALFINKLSLPEGNKDMTATEVRTRTEEHVRNLLPIFEPMEQEYNTKLLDNTFARLRRMGKFNFREMPDQLSGADFTWTFKNPLQEASTRILVSQFQETLGIVKMSMEAGERVVPVKLGKMTQDAVRGAGGPADWRKTSEEIQAELEAMVQKDSLEKAVMQAGAVAQVGQQVGDAAQSLQAGGVIPPAEGQGQPQPQPGQPKPGMAPARSVRPQLTSVRGGRAA